MSIRAFRKSRSPQKLITFNTRQDSNIHFRKECLYTSGQAGFVVQENNKNRIQILKCLVMDIKKVKTQSLVVLLREGDASSRKVSLNRYFSLTNPMLAFLEMPGTIYL